MRHGVERGEGVSIVMCEVWLRGSIWSAGFNLERLKPIQQTAKLRAGTWGGSAINLYSDRS